MNKLILLIFRGIKEFLYFLKIVWIFCILLLTLYWINNLAGYSWKWLNFIKPFFEWALGITDKIYSASYNLLGAVFEFKYFILLIIFILLAYLSNVLIDGLCSLEILYSNTRNKYKKNVQTEFNKKLIADIEQKEIKITDYSIIIKTQLKTKFMHDEIKIDIEEQNKKMCDFIFQKTALKPAIYQGSFLYSFDNFDNIDTVLDVMNKLLKSTAPLDYAICIQSDNNLEQLKKLSELNLFGKMIMAADTSYRYRFNKSHRYQMSLVGLFQNGETTLEVHEFQEIV